MKKIEPPQEVLDCLSNEMNVNIGHFLTKYHSFDYAFKDKVNDLLSSMLSDSKKTSKLDSNVHYYEKGNYEQNDFMQVMFDCFREFNTKKGLELHKAIYEHTNRGGDNWFPIVEIASPVKDYSDQPQNITVFRGCSLKEFESKNYRQSWSSELDVAKIFAFTHFNSDENKRVVIKATVSNTDIAWMRNGESEVVLLPGFTPLSSTIELDYNQYCQMKK
jgi:polyhydroxyalkanoate synthesis regulator protein